MTDDRNSAEDQPDGETEQTSAADERDEEPTPFDEILYVVFELDEPATAGAIAGRADISEDVVRQHLERLAKVDVVAADTEATPTTYFPDPGYLWYRKVRSLARKHDPDDLEMLVTTFSGSIEQYQDLSGFETLEGLRESIEAEEGSDEELIRHKNIAADWQSDEHRLALFEAALEWYELFTTDPERSDLTPDL